MLIASAGVLALTAVGCSGPSESDVEAALAAQLADEVTNPSAICIESDDNEWDCEVEFEVWDRNYLGRGKWSKREKIGESFMSYSVRCDTSGRCLYNGPSRGYSGAFRID